MKTTKVNTGIEENPKLDIIGDYWDEYLVSQIANLLREYQDLFPNSFSEMKGIVVELGEMKIPLKPYVKFVKQRPYKLNPKYNEKVRQELDKLLIMGILVPMEESEWINPMVIQDKKRGGIHICVDIQNLNDAC